MADSATQTDVPPGVLDYLRGRKVLSLATASSTGVPYATSLLYVNDGLDFYVWTRPDNLTARHIDENPSVAFTVDEYPDDWTRAKGVQASGECKVLLEPRAIRAAAALFEEKYPGLLPSDHQGLSFFRIRPLRLHFIDNAQQPQAAASFPRSLVYSVFSDLPAGEARALEATLDRVSVPAGEVLVRQGAPADKFFIIVDGAVEVLREDGDGTRVLATLQAGQFFGEMAILQDIPRTATVRSIAPTTLLTMDRTTFQSLVAQSLATTRNLDEVIRTRMDALEAGP